MKIALIIICVVLLLGIIAYGGASIYIARKFVAPLHTQFTEESSAIGPGALDFTIKTSDNVDISGWFFRNNSQCAILLAPGIHQNRISGDYGGQGIAQMALTKGYGVIMYDPRGSGKSGGDVLGFGSTEVNDINAVLKYVKEQGYVSSNIGIIGSSLGAITTLQNLNNLQDIGGIIADSGASSLQPIIERELKKEGIPSFVNPGIFLAAKLVYGVDIPGVRPIDKVKANSSKPILFIHGVKDSFIPFSNSEELVKASGPQSKLVAFETADHVESFKKDPELFEKEVFTYLENQMPQCSN